MNKPKLVVGITQGDSNGIGYEVLIKSLADSRILDSFTPVVYGSSKIFGFYRKQIHEIEQMDTYVIHSAKDVHTKRINIVNCLPDNFYAEPGQSSPDSAKAAMMSLEAAVKDLKDGYIDVLVTGPINKRAMTAEGFGYTGHTEYLQDAFGAEEIGHDHGIAAAARRHRHRPHSPQGRAEGPHQGEDPFQTPPDERVPGA
jgi:Pyridoxal phosphate biosynthesis protein